MKKLLEYCRQHPYLAGVFHILGSELLFVILMSFSVGFKTAVTIAMTINTVVLALALASAGVWMLVTGKSFWE